LNAEENDIRLDELFRKKLESAEVIPSPSFNSTLMKKLAFREFLSFNPAKLNIFYIGGAVVAGIATVLVLSLNKTDNEYNWQDTIVSENVVVSSDIPANQLPVIIEAPEYSEQPEQTTTATRTPISTNETLQVVNDSETVIENNQSPVLAERMTLEPTVAISEFINREQLTDNRLVANNRNNTKLFTSSVSSGCAPLSVSFAATSEDIDSYRWRFGGAGFSAEKSPTWIFTYPGEYNVTLEAFSSGRLVGVYTENITVYPRPTARFEISPEKAVLPDDEVRFINYSSGAVRFQWDFGDGNGSQQFEPLHRYRRYENYAVTFKAYNEYGCADSVTLRNAFSGTNYYIEFPNAFIPNQNGPSGGVYSQSSESAHVFYPVFFGVMDYNLRIFSQRGILIFESSDIEIGWDGYFNGQLGNSGVYIWQVSGKYHNGESFFKRGDVTLLRN